MMDERIANKNSEDPLLQAQACGLSRLATSDLVAALRDDRSIRDQLRNFLSTVASQEYQLHREAFIESLTVGDRDFYSRAQQISYHPKDWWRDAHDIYVVWSMMVIVREENILRGERDLLPDWLVTAAVLHDRGYALLAQQPGDLGAQYLLREGVFWGSEDSRVAHAQLSRAFAESLLANSDRFRENIERYALLEVIEKHDYPLIGRYRELSLEGRHHFDADSLYSISLSSFLKDYISYLEDGARLEQVYQSGLCQVGEFSPRTLLSIRLARYYLTEQELPAGWDRERYPLQPLAAQVGEGGECMQPQTGSAREMTSQSFLLLAECCTMLESVADWREFLHWFQDHFSHQFQVLRRRALGR